MHVEQFEVKGLAHYSYLVGCPRTRRAAVIDPRRDVDVYVEAAAREGWTITHVLETHIHADYASGAVELARRTRAEHAVSAYDAGEQYEAKFPHRDLLDGDAIDLGTVRLRALHTPGHTPEHVSFVAYAAQAGAPPGIVPHPGPLPKGEGGGRGAHSGTLLKGGGSGRGAHSGRLSDGEEVVGPVALFSGDFLFVGSLGRPDLLGEDAKRRLAEQLYDSCRTRLTGLPDELVVYPAHGAGSMCGAGMAAKPSTTLGAERTTNPYLDPTLTKAAFIDSILGSVPPFPPYYRRMKQLNAAGARPLAEVPGVPTAGGLPGGEALLAAQFRERVDAAGHVVIDVRGQHAYGAGHVPGSFGIGLDSGLAVWAAWVVPYETPLLLVTERPEDVEAASRWLVRVGLDDIRGHLAGGFEAWRAAGHPIVATAQVTPAEVHQRMQRGDAINLIDLRTDGEWSAGHAPGARHIMGGFLADRLDELRGREGAIALICGSGYRSTVAAGVCERAGMKDVMNVTGGMQAWRAAGLPVEK